MSAATGNSRSFTATPLNLLPAIAAIVCLAVLLWNILAAAYRLNDHHFVYALDDAYIHMALAKNLVLHHIYGVTRYEVAPASSSILWPWLVAGVYALFGVNEYAPIILNVLSAIGLLLFANSLFVRYSPGRFATIGSFLSLATLIMGMPLQTLCVIGMEHVTHTLALVVFAAIVAKSLAEPKHYSDSVMSAALGCSAFIAAGLRYESLSTIGVASALMILYARDWKRAAIILAFGLLPALIYGAIAYANGQFILPNSILSKSGIYMATQGGVLSRMALSWKLLPMTWALLIFAIVQLAMNAKQVKSKPTFSVIFAVLAVTTTIVHFAVFNNYLFYRYQAYLNGFLVIGNALLIFETLSQVAAQPRYSRPLAGVSALLAICFVFVLHPLPFIQNATVLASNDIYQQQWRDAQFLATYYDHDSVMLNDIGAACYYSDIRLLDIADLGSTPILRMVAHKEYTVQNFLRIVHDRNVSIAILYAQWVPYFEPSWQIVMTRNVPVRIVSAFDRVEYIAVAPGSAPTLRQNLRQFFH